MARSQYRHNEEKSFAAPFVSRFKLGQFLAQIRSGRAKRNGVAENGVQVSNRETDARWTLRASASTA